MSTDSFERELRATLNAHAEVEIPAPPIDVLTGRGNAMKTRRRLGLAVAGVAAAAAVIAAVAVPVATFHRSAPVQPAAPSDASVPYVQDGVLHLDGLTGPAPKGVYSFAIGDLVATAGNGGVIKGPAQGGEAVATWTVTYAKDERLVSRTAPGAPGGLLIPPSGRYAFLIHQHGRGVTATVWDPRANAVIARRHIPVYASSIGTDMQGRLFLSPASRSDVTMWNPGSAPVKVTGIPANSYLSLHAGTVVFDGRQQWAGTIDNAGAFHRVTTLPAAAQASSPDGSSYLYDADADGTPDAHQDGLSTWVASADGSRRRLGVPDGAVSSPLWFVDDTHVLVVAESIADPSATNRAKEGDTPLGTYVCDVTTGSCSQLASGSRGALLLRTDG